MMVMVYQLRMMIMMVGFDFLFSIFMTDDGERKRTMDYVLHYFYEPTIILDKLFLERRSRERERERES